MDCAVIKYGFDIIYISLYAEGNIQILTMQCEYGEIMQIAKERQV